MTEADDSKIVTLSGLGTQLDELAPIVAASAEKAIDFGVKLATDQGTVDECVSQVAQFNAAHMEESCPELFSYRQAMEPRERIIGELRRIVRECAEELDGVDHGDTADQLRASLKLTPLQFWLALFLQRSAGKIHIPTLAKEMVEAVKLWGTNGEVKHEPVQPPVT